MYDFFCLILGCEGMIGYIYLNLYSMKQINVPICANQTVNFTV